MPTNEDVLGWSKSDVPKYMQERGVTPARFAESTDLRIEKCDKIVKRKKISKHTFPAMKESRQIWDQVADVCGWKAPEKVEITERKLVKI